jgi:hypothetical protein
LGELNEQGKLNLVRMKRMNKTVAIDYLVPAAPANATADARVAAGRALSNTHPQPRLDLGFGKPAMNNERLTLRHHGAAGDPKCDGSGDREGRAELGRLNALFAISVNSPSVSMVNFSCCVWSAQSPRAHGVTRRVTPQPTRSAVRMEAGVHAGV